MKNLPDNYITKNKIFRDFILGLIKDSQAELYFKTIKKRSIYNHFSAIVSTQEESIPKIKKILHDQNDFNIKEFEIKLLKGIYLENNNDQSMLIFAPKKKHINLDENTLSQNRFINICFDLQNIGEKLNIKNLGQFNFATSHFISELDDMAVANFLKMPSSVYIKQKYINSIKKYIDFYKEHKRNIIDRSDSNEYNHIQIFSRIYYWIIKVLSDTFKEENHELSLHDVGTYHLYFPSTLRGLTKSDLMGVNITSIIASDYMKINDFFINLYYSIDEKEQRSIEFVQLDITDMTKKIPVTDITIAIDVLEHLKNHQIAYDSLKRLWEHTKKILIIHVPLEEKPNAIWDHNITFSPEILTSWASKLDDGVILSEEYDEIYGGKLTNYGYIIIKRT